MDHDNEAIAESETPKKRISILWVVLCLLGAIGTNAAILIPAFNGSDGMTTPQTGLSVVFWSAILFAVVWKYRRKNGWVGFGLGVVFGFMMLFISSFITGYMKASKPMRELESLDATDTEKVSEFMDSTRGTYASRLDTYLKQGRTDKAKSLSAEMFLGFYYRVGIETPNFCEGLGVNISAFNEKFKDIHKNEYQTAVTLLSSKGVTINDFYKNVSKGGHITKFVRAELEEARIIISKNPGWESASLANVCELFNSLPQNDQAMAAYTFSNLSPSVNEVLMK